MSDLSDSLTGSPSALPASSPRPLAAAKGERPGRSLPRFSCYSYQDPRRHRDRFLSAGRWRSVRDPFALDYGNLCAAFSLIKPEQIFAILPPGVACRGSRQAASYPGSRHRAHARCQPEARPIPNWHPNRQPSGSINLANYPI